MFDPSQADVRRFFCDTWRRHRDGEPLTPLQAIALDWIVEHPEYHGDLDSIERALEARYDAGTAANPFLHLSMHLSISEQFSIDQPPGIRAGCEALARRHGSMHEAAHQVMECLGEMLWRSQRSGTPPDGLAYVECVRRRAGS